MAQTTTLLLVISFILNFCNCSDSFFDHYPNIEIKEFQKKGTNIIICKIYYYKGKADISEKLKEIEVQEVAASINLATQEKYSIDELEELKKEIKNAQSFGQSRISIKEDVQKVIEEDNFYTIIMNCSKPDDKIKETKIYSGVCGPSVKRLKIRSQSNGQYIDIDLINFDDILKNNADSNSNYYIGELDSKGYYNLDFEASNKCSVTFERIEILAFLCFFWLACLIYN